MRDVLSCVGAGRASSRSPSGQGADSPAAEIDDGELSAYLALESEQVNTADVLRFVRQMSLFDGMAEGYQHRCGLRLEMGCSAEAAYQGLWRMAQWPQILPHVKSVDVLYDDGRFQEFLMAVESEQGLLHVRSVRRCEPGVGIRFFQPVPPRFLKHHAGGWRFRSLAPGRCEVTTFHCWNLPDHANGELTAQSARKLLTEHARLALQVWKRHLEVRSS